jgi:hypothetical protein
MAEERIASPQAIKVDKENIDGIWYVTLKILGHGCLKFSPNVAHNIARALVGKVNECDKLDGNIITMANMFRKPGGSGRGDY